MHVAALGHGKGQAATVFGPEWSRRHSGRREQHDAAVVLQRECARLRAVGIHHPDVLHWVAETRHLLFIAVAGDAAAVGRPGGRGCAADAVADAARVTAVCVRRPDIAKRVIGLAGACASEGEAPAIRRPGRRVIVALAVGELLHLTAVQ